MKKSPLVIKTFFSYVVFLFLGFFIITLLMPYFLMPILTEARAAQLYRQALILSEKESMTHEDLINATKLYDSRIMIISPQGQIQFDTLYPAEQAQNLPFLDDFNTALTSHGYYQVGNYFETLSEESISIHLPLRNGVKITGYLSNHLPLTSLKPIEQKIIYLMYQLLGYIAITSLLFLIVIYFMIIRPIRLQQPILKQYEKGHYQSRLFVDSQDEIEDTYRVMDTLAKRLLAGDHKQSSFIANVSHDFRSPLTSIRGYIEAVLDGTIPKENQDYYLKIVLQQTERLTKLTEGLLTIAKLDNSNQGIEPIIFDIHQLLRDSASSFEGVCQKRFIQFQLNLASKSLLVLADMGKIGQVITNLLDNAIKFSPDHTQIVISTKIKHQKVEIRIKDMGMGIAPEEIDKVWDRFYKSDLSRGKDQKGTGLGLAIVKEILQLHKEEIYLESKLGVGSEFIFTLPYAKN